MGGGGGGARSQNSHNAGQRSMIQSAADAIVIRSQRLGVCPSWAQIRRRVRGLSDDRVFFALPCLTGVEVSQCFMTPYFHCSPLATWFDSSLVGFPCCRCADDLIHISVHPARPFTAPGTLQWRFASPGQRQRAGAGITIMTVAHTESEPIVPYSPTSICRYQWEPMGATDAVITILMQDLAT